MATELHRFCTQSYAVVVNGVCTAKCSKKRAHQLRKAAKAQGHNAFVGMSDRMKVGDAWVR